ncbi:hypothetical protein [Mycobacterium sp. NAZ190054]|uniref:hypothetical protein n=1 Tax=Mycobacterium sp. NAZ190054 TaxID=1747766 RepID=UPI000795B6E1|nr:hypothetical protein [Mycobacterium sp. NAZ190054]KWX57493.1 hypothetical protein ASJ79_11385 [Mycobacterium sp. NAZ190054]
MNRFRRLSVTGLVAAGAAAALIAAPAATAATHLDCTYTAPGNSLCESAGNAQIVATPTDVPYPAWGAYPYGVHVFRGGHHHHLR